MKPAPPLVCAGCGRIIGKSRAHSLTDDHRVLCSRCLADRRLHPRMWPDCPEDWHDCHDHVTSVAGTRAGVAAVLGVWP